MSEYSLGLGILTTFPTGRRSSPGGRRSWGRGRGRPVCRSSCARTWGTPFSCLQAYTIRRDPLHITHSGRHGARGSGHPAHARARAKVATRAYPDRPAGGDTIGRWLGEPNANHCAQTRSADLVCLSRGRVGDPSHEEDRPALIVLNQEYEWMVRDKVYRGISF